MPKPSAETAQSKAGDGMDPTEPVRKVKVIGYEPQSLLLSPSDHHLLSELLSRGSMALSTDANVPKRTASRALELAPRVLNSFVRVYSDSGMAKYLREERQRQIEDEDAARAAAREKVRREREEKTRLKLMSPQDRFWQGFQAILASRPDHLKYELSDGAIVAVLGSYPQLQKALIAVDPHWHPVKPLSFASLAGSTLAARGWPSRGSQRRRGRHARRFYRWVRTAAKDEPVIGHPT